MLWEEHNVSRLEEVANGSIPASEESSVDFVEVGLRISSVDAVDFGISQPFGVVAETDFYVLLTDHCLSFVDFEVDLLAFERVCSHSHGFPKVVYPMSAWYSSPDGAQERQQEEALEL